jgi:hypothetical protein
VLPILIAVRKFDKQILNKETLKTSEMKHLFNPKEEFKLEDLLAFFNIS